MTPDTPLERGPYNSQPFLSLSPPLEALPPGAAQYNAMAALKTLVYQDAFFCLVRGTSFPQNRSRERFH